ncbi:MAG: DUF3299 domain-containing protein [Verrucomicrobia bacterium]|nr:DUF3299 domain-containing protein [Verrucomicrobiota bacterium]
MLLLALEGMFGYFTTPRANMTPNSAITDCRSRTGMWRAPACGLAAALWAAGLSGCGDSGTPKHTASSGTNTLLQGELIQPLVVSNTASPTVSTIPPGSPIEAAPTAPTQQVAVVSQAGLSNSVTATSNPSASNASNAAIGLSTNQLVAADGETLIVGFDKLSAFNFEVSDDILQAGTTNAADVAKLTAEQIPKDIKDYDQKRISLKGFMLPLKVEGGKVTELLLMRDQSMCCYGAVPKINEWVSVKMVGGGVKPLMDQAVTLQGKLFVGEMRENGYLIGIYRMDGETLDGPVEN